MDRLGERGLVALAFVNVALQVFDGVATYIGLRAGIEEANPLVAWTVTHLGPASALCLFKLAACVCLLALWLLRRNRLAAPALALSAAVYAVCSLTPWTAALARVHLG